MKVSSVHNLGISPLEQGDLEGDIPVYGLVLYVRTMCLLRVGLFCIAALNGR